jgi:hypothetical protein
MSADPKLATPAVLIKSLLEKFPVLSVMLNFSFIDINRLRRRSYEQNKPVVKL